MADEGLTVRNIQWRHVFGFTHIFRAFRIAIHPSKIFLCLCLLLAIYLGGRIMDAIWFRSSRAVPGEVQLFEDNQGSQSARPFNQIRAESWQSVNQDYAGEVQDYLHSVEKNKSDADIQKEAQDDADKGQLQKDVRDYVISQREKEIGDVDTAYQAEIAAAEKETDPDTQKADISEANQDRDNKISSIMDDYGARLTTIDNASGVGIFSSFFEYETHQASSVIAAIFHNDWTGSSGVTGHLIDFIAIGPYWLASIHTLYAIIFAIIFLSAWSLFGGAVSRIAAVHVARDERISVRRATNFAAGKFLSFASAPILPLGLVVVIGLVVTIPCLILTWIPYIGPIILGVAFLPALLAGFFMTLIAIGTIGGFNLMYPTVAVEGSDSFDAISRSLTYVYGRPWKMLFYTAVAIVYGAITYCFVRFFIIITLGLTHHFVGMGMFGRDIHGYPLLNTMWPDPFSSQRLTYHIDWSLLNWGQAIGAAALSFWVYLVIAILGAFALSFYFTASTIIYYLMRQDLDAAELDDVYLEQFEEEFNFPSTTPAPAGETTVVMAESAATATLVVAPPAETIKPPGAA
ncbi:MAG TPA: hypothetical protein VMD30_08695 [Tepidisphaeraceae bacterium]|nr:hypothetical protein [Tepidisphaeraceae bacterium]